jgi:hypothetical protein
VRIEIELEAEAQHLLESSWLLSAAPDSAWVKVAFWAGRMPFRAGAMPDCDVGFRWPRRTAIVPP